jgi:hypothetical protein
VAQVTVQDILREGFTSYHKKHPLPPYVVRAAERMIKCRTSALGGHVKSCRCGHVERVWYNSCKHRACPQCAFLEVEKWLARQQERLLACDHYHTVFTVPAELNGVWQYNRRLFAQLLFNSVRDTLFKLLGDEQHMGGLPGMIMALHTWGSDLITHPHIHCLVTGGGLAEDGTWKRVRRKCLLPRKPLMIVFRGKFRAALLRALARGELRLPPQMREAQLRGVLNKLGRQVWNVKILECFAEGRGVLTYLARYLRGGPITNRRLLCNDQRGVTFLCKDSRHLDPQGRPTKKTVTLSRDQFIHRLLEHVPPPQMQMVRSYGLYANNQSQPLDTARRLLGQRPVAPPARLLAVDVLRCFGEAEPERCPVCHEPVLVRKVLHSSRPPPQQHAA